MKISKILFFILVFFIPIGTRKIFFTHASFYLGYHAFYNSLYLYLTDLIIFGLIFVWLLENRKIISREMIRSLWRDQISRYLMIFVIICSVSVFVSYETKLALYGVFKIFEFTLVFLYIKANISVSREIRMALLILLFSVSLQAILGIYQYSQQSSLGLKILGEEYLRPKVYGIAQFLTTGLSNFSVSRETLVFRAYGTNPHPNILAALLMVGLIVNFYLFYSFRTVFYNKSSFLKMLLQVLLVFSMLLISSALVLTFSRLIWGLVLTAIVFWFLIILVWLRGKHGVSMKQIRMPPETQRYFPGRLIVIALTLIFCLCLNWLVFSNQIKDRLQARGEPEEIARQESFADRAEFNNIAIEMIKKNFLFGVGARNFVVKMDEFNRPSLDSRLQRGGGVHLLPQQHQPVHNIYLLIAAESGVAALVIFLIFIYYIVRRGWEEIKTGDDPVLHVSLLIIFFSLLAGGLFDHYIWTLQQGSFAFWLIGGFLAAIPQQS